jgi:hypothetical protein
MLRKKVLIGCALLSLVAITVVAAAPPPAGGWIGLFDALLGEGGTHLVIVRGTVLFDGTTFAGGDFNVIKSPSADGTYFVGYTDGTFSDTPTVLVQIVGSDVGPNEAITYVESETLVGFNVETKFGGVLTNRSFKFIAVGPR